MAGIGSKAVVALVATFALSLVAAASAASPDVSAMNLQAVDVPGAKLVNQRVVKEKGYIAAYERTFAFTAPGRGAGLVLLDAETQLGSTASVAASDVATAEKPFRSIAGRKRLAATIAKSEKVKLKAVTVGALRRVAGYDQGFELPISFPAKGQRAYENLIVLRLDRVFVFIFEVGLRPISVATSAKYATAIAGHIGTELAPIDVAPPTVTGTAVQGQTLTAAPGTWSAPEATFAYQWQHCDAAGATCTDIAGATAQTYAVTPADVGSTLLVVVKATNRFGSPTAPSVATAVVS
jgi:hypothetical protein